jgi:hypothetical protein
MAEKRSLPRKIDLPPALDWDFLRAEGLDHIQKLSGQIWTDHNSHDPGITILEILAYALTDLAYRSGFDTKDLLTGADGRTDPPELSGLFPAHEVLTTAPRTIEDYRRLLLRIEGVRNAWLDPMNDPSEPENYRLSEAALYADCLTNELEYKPTNAAGEPNRRVRLSGLYKVLVELEIDDLLGSKQQRRVRALEAVAAVLHAHRGLCEDFFSIDTVTPYRVAVCADIEVALDADLEEIQAKVYREVEKYLSPPIIYRTLSELLAEGNTSDEIFNGPFVDFEFTVDGEPVFTKPGFITDADLEATRLRRRVHGSDIINVVVDVDGVEAIRNLQLQAYDAGGLAIGDSAVWTLTVPPDHQPVFYMEGSKLLFHRAGIPYRPQITEFKRTLDHLRALDRREVYVEPGQVLSMPVGRWRNTDAFYSVQHDFPENYKIGEAGISGAEEVGRIAKARQLKGYLTFFDQLLADYLGQLANLRRLYSLDKSLTRSWFSPYMTGIAGSLKDFPDEFYVDATALADETTRTRLTETERDYLERRNRLLDHLIARFAERFSDYALMSFRLSGDRLKSSEDLIDDKIDFLTGYPRLSRERGQAANLRPTDLSEVWDSDNISGLERRAGRLLGIADLTRRNLHCEGHFAALFSTRKSDDRFRVVIREGGSQLFASQETFATRDAAMKVAETAYSNLRDEAAFKIAAEDGTTTWKVTIVSGDRTLTHNTAFDSEGDAFAAARRVIDRYDALLGSAPCDTKGMHLIEHILLRPQAVDDPRMDICLGEGCEPCGDEDPYSFRVSVVLPYWPEDFRNLDYRAQVERTIREEAPAHVQVRICWIDQAQMMELDKAYKAWLLARAARKPKPDSVRQSAESLIRVLGALKSVYPAAELHDCDVGEGDNPVRLGASALGIF